MAVLARSSITLVTSVDIDSVYWFYILQASTAAAPAKPTTVPATKGNAPSGWSKTEPTTVDINKTLYRVELTYFTDGTGVYSSVNQVSSYEAAKVAYNKASDVQTNLDDAYDKLQSMGEQLVVNGSAFTGDNTNFSTWTFDGSVANGTKGSFTKPSNYAGTPMIDEAFPIDITKRYRFEFDAKSKNKTARHYSFLNFYDVDGNTIYANHHMFIANTLTTLSQDLKNGDTVVHLADLTNWKTSTGTATHQRGLTFWNYKNSFGYQYPELTYSRNTWANLYTDANVNKTAKTIRLSSPWTHGTFPAGTKVSQSNSGANYKYNPWSNSLCETTWTHYVGYYDGTDYSGNNVQTKFPPGAATAKVGFLWNYQSQSTTDQLWITNVSVMEDVKTSISNAQTTANNAATAASTAQTTANNAATAASNAQTTANSAQTTANAANSNASTALSTANTANSNASTALSTANDAKTTAQNAESRVRFKGAIKANNASGYGAITAGNIIVGTSAGYHHLKLGKQFDINYPILYCGTNIASGGTKDDNYTVYPVTITTTQNITLTPYKAVYIKGTLAGSLFTPASTTPLTQTEPTSASDTNYYMRLGLAYDSTHMYLEADHPIYRWSAGAFRLFGSSADEIVRAWCKDTTVTTIGGMEINGAHIATKSIEADSINVNSLEAIVAKIGNWSIGGKTDSAPSSGAETEGSIYTGSFGSDGSIYLIPSGTTTSKSIGGSDPPRTDWRITAGSSFGVTSDGSLYASNAYLSNATISGTVTATYGKIGKWNIVNNLETVQLAAGAPEGSLCYKKAGTTDSIVLVAGGTLPRNVTIAGYSRNDWKIMVSNAFGVKANGDLVANNAVFKESVVAYGGLAAEVLSTTGTLKDQISNSDISVYSWDHFVFFSGDGISVANFSTYIQTWCNGSSSGQSGDWRIKDGWRPIKNIWFPFIYSHNGFRMGCMQIRADGYINAYIYPTYGSGAKDVKNEYRNNNTTNITGSDSLFFNASWIRA